MRDDDEGNKPTPDSDRAAILARRRQFIALALSGLTTTAACTDGNEKPDGKTQQPAKEAPKDHAPQVCLSVAPPTDPPPIVLESPENDPEMVPPQVCLKISRPPDDPEPKPEPKPQPCLKKAAPKPCLKVAPESG